MKIAVAFSTLSGNTALVARDLAAFLIEKGHKTDLLDLFSTNPDTLKDYELVFLGGSTYGAGELNPITEIFFSLAEEKAHNCNHTQFAFFSLGDLSYSNFSVSGKLSSEKIDSMHGCVLKPIFQIDGYPKQEILKDSRRWAEKSILSQLS